MNMKKLKQAKKKFTKSMTIGEALRLHENAEIVLTGFGMHCLACPYSQMESLEQAAQVHEIDVDLLIEKLNELLK